MSDIFIVFYFLFQALLSMSITLKGNSDIKSKTPNVHLMACEIKHDGNASVERYFHNTVREEDKGLLKKMLKCS